MKRFTETEKWKDVWFRSLPCSGKLLFLYVIENCNNAGFYEIDAEMVRMQTGLTDDEIEGAWKGLERGIVRTSGWAWVRTFLKHQKNSELNEANPFHRQIIGQYREQSERFSKIPEFEAFKGPYKGLLSPIGKGTGKGKGKRSAEEKPGAAPEIPEPLKSVDGFEARWAGFTQHRKEIKKPLTPLAASGILQTLAQRPEDAINALDTAIRRSWQGFEWAWLEKEKPNGAIHSTAPPAVVPDPEGWRDWIAGNPRISYAPFASCPPNWKEAFAKR